MPQNLHVRGENGCGNLRELFLLLLGNFSETLEHKCTDGRWPRSAERVNANLPQNKTSLCSGDIAVRVLAFLMFDYGNGEEPRPTNHLALALHFCLSLRFMFAVTPIPCFSSMTWQFVKRGDSAI